jgi:hypothetical protein
MSQENLQDYYGIIEGCIEKLGFDAEACRTEQLGQWNLTRGSANVWIDCWHIELQGRAYYQVMSPLIEIPQENHRQMFEELLGLNDKLFGVSFTLYNGLVWLKSIREARGMDVEEAMNILARISTYADMYDDYLSNKYGGRMIGSADSVSAPGPTEEAVR